MCQHIYSAIINMHERKKMSQNNFDNKRRSVLFQNNETSYLAKLWHYATLKYQF